LRLELDGQLLGSCDGRCAMQLGANDEARLQQRIPSRLCIVCETCSCQEAECEV
jgi:hypothetical protein